MPIDALSAANAYRNQLKMMQDAGTADTGSSGGSGAAGGTSFMKMVENAAQDAANTQYKAEAVQMGSLTGDKVDLTDLTTAVANAELSLQTVVAIRDRVINAYNDIIKMSI